jgi:hypothetical protein
MIALADIERRILALQSAADDPARIAERLVILGEDVLSHWVVAQGETPTYSTHEGFRLLALQRQGSRGLPSFNACRETCRELIWHQNLIDASKDEAEAQRLAGLACRVALHLYFFVAGKLEDAGIGDFCCSSRDARQTAWQQERQAETLGNG